VRFEPVDFGFINVTIILANKSNSLHFSPPGAAAGRSERWRGKRTNAEFTSNTVSPMTPETSHGHYRLIFYTTNVFFCIYNRGPDRYAL
jgi:hypothetical protein